MTATLIEAYSRRLLAFHEPSPEVERIAETVEEFYNHAHDPKDGRFTSGSGSAGGKVWTGVSAHPDRRVKPKAGAFSADEATAKRVYEADLGNGYRSHVTESFEAGGALGVRGEIRFNGRRRGYFERLIMKHPDGTLSAEHELLVIDGHHKGLGVADRFNAHAVAEYQRMGVDRITLTAGDNNYIVGGYAWARQGFRLNQASEGANKQFIVKHLDRMDTQLLKPVYREHAAKVRKEIKALKAALEAGEDIQPIHVASIGEKYARHKTEDAEGVPYETWPGKDVLLGTSWKGVYYFDANRAITAAAVDLVHAALRNEQFYNQNHSPRDGKFTSGPSRSEAPSNGKKTYPGTVWVGDYRSSRAITGYSAEMQGIKGYDTSNIEMLWGKNDKTGVYDVPSPNKMGKSAEYNAREEAGALLDAVYKVAPVEKTLWSGQRSDAFSKHLKSGDTIDLPTTATTSREAEAHYYPKQGGTVLRFEGGTKAVRITEAAGGIPEWVTAGRFVVSSVSEKPHQQKEGTVREVTLQQTHVFDRNTGSWVSVAVSSVQSSAALVEALACHDKACAPPPAGTGGSAPLQARRGAVAGYGPTARRDIHLGSVRVTYKPDYPDDHPDPGEIVWAKVRYQENAALSKDRPVLIIGRINGTDKLAAVQLTTSAGDRKDRLPIGTGSWDRLGRNASIKLDQIIVVDPKDYRREGSKFEREKFEGVIGRLAAFHRTSVTIAASAKLLEHWHESGGIEFACHDASCRPPGSGGTGGSSPSGHGKTMTEIGEIDYHKFDPMTGYSESGMIKHLGSLAVTREMTDREHVSVENDLDYEVKDFSSGSREPFAEAVAIANANVATVPRTTVGISVQLGAIWDRYADMTDDFKIMDKVTDALTRYEGEYQTDLRGARAKLSRQLEVISGVSVASGFVSYVHQQWANSAHSHESVAMQLIAAKDRNLTAANASLKRHVKPGDLAVARALVKKAPDALGAVFSATYRLTQRELAKHGITEVELYRGVRISTMRTQAAVNSLAKIIAQPSPLSSWSTSQLEAFNFATHGKMFKAKVPASQVYSLANLSGTGALNEREVLVLGNRITATEHQLQLDPKDVQSGKFEDFAEEEILVVEIDAEDFDWIKRNAVSASAEEFYNKNHDKAGRFATGAGHKVITAAQARGDSRPVTHAEFQRLAGIGQKQLDVMSLQAAETTGLNRHWDSIKRDAYAEVKKPWGGATIDSHTGVALPQGANAYAITVKGKGAKTVSVHENATEAEFSAAMDQAKKVFGPILERQGHHLGVFHDDDNHRIDIDPVLVVRSSRDVETIGAASHSIGGAFNFRDGLGYFPPHVDTSPGATNKRDDYERTYDS